MLLDPNLGLVRNVVLPLANRGGFGFNSTPTEGMFPASFGYVWGSSVHTHGI
jgi:hypothetical protein